MAEPVVYSFVIRAPRGRRRWYSYPAEIAQVVAEKMRTGGLTVVWLPLIPAPAAQMFWRG